LEKTLRGENMARREIHMNEVMEILYHWHQGASIKGIRRSLGYDRKTIRRYLRRAQEVGLKREEPFPDEQEMLGKLKELLERSTLVRGAPAKERLRGYRDEVQTLLTEKEMTVKQVMRLLAERHGLKVSYSSVLRYVGEEFNLGKPEATVHLETEPGEEAQVDFGYVGLMRDPETGKDRKTWCFILTLSYSRHRFVRFVFRQDSPTWIECHIRAFEFFHGVPARVVLDNLKVGVIKPDFYDPRIHFAYADLERHYDFVADPAKVRKPKHKGKVERGIPVVRQHLLAGRKFRDIRDANERALAWCRFEIGSEVHGTTKRKPYETFISEEKERLKLLPPERFEIPVWKECTVHPDHHIVFEQSFYSLPTRYIGKKVCARGTSKSVGIFLDHQLIKTHSRALEPGKWMTDQTDYPPHKLAYLMSTPGSCLAKAAQYGSQTCALIEEVLKPGGHRSMRKAQAILRLGEKWGEDLEKASEKALSYGNTDYRSIRLILEKDLLATEAPAEPVPLSKLGQSFLRESSYFSGEVCS
jgi:transposase